MITMFKHRRESEREKANDDRERELKKAQDAHFCGLLSSCALDTIGSN
jgi:hypothetical protein